MNINQKLCIKDPRNPMFHDIYEFEDEKPEPRKDCACDNCFYGRDKLALEILRIKVENEDFKHCLRGFVEYFEAIATGEYDTNRRSRPLRTLEVVLLQRAREAVKRHRAAKEQGDE